MATGAGLGDWRRSWRLAPGFAGSACLAPGFAGSACLAPRFAGSACLAPGFAGSACLARGLPEAPAWRGVCRKRLPGAGVCRKRLPGAGVCRKRLPGAGVCRKRLPGAGVCRKRLPGACLAPGFAGSACLAPGFAGSACLAPGFAGSACLAALPRVRPVHLVHRTLERAQRGGEPGDPWSEPSAVRLAVRRALRDAWIEMSASLGPNRDKWVWGRLHPLFFAPAHPTAGRGWRGGLGPFPYGGDGASIRIADYRMLDSFGTEVAAIYRFRADAAELDQALTSLAPGQSEHPGHPHEVNGLERWLAGRPTLLSTSDPVIEDTEVARLRLEPAGASGP